MAESQLDLESPTSLLASRRAAAYTALALVVLTTFVYFPILQAMVLHWRIVPDYSHGFLVLPLSIYFAYEKKYKLEAAHIEGSWLGVAPLLVGLGLLALGQLGSILTPLRAGYVFTLMGLVLLILGREVFRLLLFPLLFLLLMVPLPQSLVNVIAFPLQLIAAQWAVATLQLLDIPVLLEGNIIHLPHSDLFVAEACSGLRSLMALLTLGVVFAQFFRKGKRLQQLILIASTLPIAVFVNAVRVAVTGGLSHYVGPETAGGFIHDFQGMITFTLAFFLLLSEAKALERLEKTSIGQRVLA
jgi:exosortase